MGEASRIPGQVPARARQAPHRTGIAASYSHRGLGLVGFAVFRAYGLQGSHI